MIYWYIIGILLPKNRPSLRPSGPRDSAPRGHAPQFPTAGSATPAGADLGFSMEHGENMKETLGKPEEKMENSGRIEKHLVKPWKTPGELRKTSMKSQPEKVLGDGDSNSSKRWVIYVIFNRKTPQKMVRLISK